MNNKKKWKGYRRESATIQTQNRPVIIIIDEKQMTPKHRAQSDFAPYNPFI